MFLTNVTRWVGVCEALRQQWPGACFIAMPSLRRCAVMHSVQSQDVYAQRHRSAARQLHLDHGLLPRFLQVAEHRHLPRKAPPLLHTAIS